ncbi:MAG TPA: biotin/lipoate A/B protein ligase family protein [Gemmataceae bacterium]|jgi:lipoate-protein ligase A
MNTDKIIRSYPCSSVSSVVNLYCFLAVMQPPHCRLLPFHIADGAWNMAADEVLLETAAAGVASLRLYGWSRPTLSLGYFQSSATCRTYSHLGELDWVRRPSGGATLVHHLEVTYALGLPAGTPWQKRGESWLRRMHDILLDALASLGATARICVEEKKLGEVLCFLHHTPGDLLIGDAKIAGSAQRKQRGALMQHGSILLVASPFTLALPGLREQTGLPISPESLCAAAMEHFARRTAWDLVPSEWEPAERHRIEELAAGKYAQPAWNRKR